jgi:hypothetical protein
MAIQAGTGITPSDIPYIVRRGYRDSTFPSGSTWTTTEALVYRIDNIPVRAGKLYEISTGQLNVVPSVANDIGSVRLKYLETGPWTMATAGVLALGVSRVKQTETSNTDIKPMIVYYVPTTDLNTLSIGLTLQRVAAGTSSLGVRLFGTSNEPVHIAIKCLGDDPGVSGTPF